MTFALGILTFFVVLAALILVHELGHFTFAKLFGVRVDEFGLGFPPRLKSWRRGETVYSLNAVPLGGFVRMLGENGDASVPESFGSKPPWQRLIILVAGPTMNIVLSISIFFVINLGVLGGETRANNVIAGVIPRSPAQTAGLRPGDRIVALDGVPVSSGDDLASQTQRRLGRRIHLVVARGSRSLHLALIPRVHHPRNQGPMGVVLGVGTVAYSPGKALREAANRLVSMVSGLPLVAQSLAGNGPPDQHVSGPIGIANLTTQVVQNEPVNGFASILELVAILSGSLGILNLLPIPALDGGRVVFVLISWARRRNTDPEFEGLVHLVGMALLLLLITLVSYQDIVRWISGGSS